MKCFEVLNWLERELEAVSESAKVEARQLVTFVMKFTTLDLILNQQSPVDESQIERLKSFLQRRLDGEPLQYILGTQIFYGNEFVVDGSVLIPRPETEILVEKVLEMVQNSYQGKTVNILDMGCGSGAIAITLALYAQQVQVHAVDISDKALATCRENAIRLGALPNMRFTQSDYFLSLEDEMYDVIVSNPPYIPLSDQDTLKKEVDGYEPHLALYGGQDGLDAYRQMIPAAMRHLNSGGFLVFEAGHDQATEILELMKKHQYINCMTFADLNGIERFIACQKA